jgi:hypothetical protein
MRQANDEAMGQGEGACTVSGMAIDETIPEEEEGESQQVTHSRKVESYGN